MSDDPVISLMLHMQTDWAARFGELEKQRLELHKENIGNFKDMREQLTILTTAFHQMKGGVKVLYWLGGLTVGAAAIWEAIWHTRHI